MNNHGKFISLEGGEGLGKSTCLALLADHLRQKGCDVVETREPGGTALGESIRSLFLDPNIGSIDSMAELLLIFAARSQHLNEVILPALSQGKWVVCDRFTEASYAYQGGGRGLAFEQIDQLKLLVQKKLSPDLTFLFDAPLEVGMARAKSRGTTDRMEQESIEFFTRIRETYLLRAKQNPRQFHIVDAAQPLEDVTCTLFERVEVLLA